MLFTETITYFNDVREIVAFYKISRKNEANDRTYKDIIVDSSLNFCKTMQGVAGDFFGKTILMNLKEAADHKLQCPFKKVNFLIIKKIIELINFYHLGNLSNHKP